MNENAKKSNIQNYFDFLYFVFLTKLKTSHMACMPLKNRCRIDVYTYEKNVYFEMFSNFNVL